METVRTISRNRRSNLPKLPVEDVVFAFLLSMLAAFYLDAFSRHVNNFFLGAQWEMSSPVPSFPIQFTCVAFSSFALLMAIRTKTCARFFSACFKWRYPIAAAALIVLVLFEISGSSIGYWAYPHEIGGDTNGVMWGIPRAIRSDEWLVSTPLAFSQSFNEYAATSDLIRADATDVSFTTALPCWSLSTVFRPQYWGYLLFGSSYGLAFFWSGRLIALLLASFEFGRILVKDNRALALAYALFIVFSPIVQWWFSLEILIFGQVMLVAFHFFLRTPKLGSALAWGALLSYTTGCFIMIVYPAWQVCFGYLGIAFIIAEIIDYRRLITKGAIMPIRKRKWMRWTSLAIVLLFMAAAVAGSIFLSIDAIRTIGATTYPGARLETGGNLLSFALNYVDSWLGALIPDLFLPNVCEHASFFTIFPLGIILACFAIARTHDVHLICLLIVQAILLIFGFFGFPEALAKITLLSNTPTGRLVYATGFIDIMLLFRATILLNTSKSAHYESSTVFSKPLSLVMLPLIASATITAFYYFVLYQITFKIFIIMSFVFLALSIYAFLSFAIQGSSPWAILGIALLITLSGSCVNPIQHGALELTDNYLTHETALRPYDKNAEQSIWAGDDSTISQALVASGAKTISTIAPYPSLDTWHQVDPKQEYEDIYNRYAHISMQPTFHGTTFETPNGSMLTDSIIIKINVNDIPKLGIDYWVSDDDLTAFNNESVTFIPESTHTELTIYRIEY